MVCCGSNCLVGTKTPESVAEVYILIYKEWMQEIESIRNEQFEQLNLASITIGSAIVASCSLHIYSLSRNKENERCAV